MCSLNADSRTLEHEFQFDSVFRRLPPLASKFRGLATVTLQQLRGRCLYNLVLVARHSPTGHQVVLSKFIWKFQVSLFIGPLTQLMIITFSFNAFLVLGCFEGSTVPISKGVPMREGR